MDDRESSHYSLPNLLATHINCQRLVNLLQLEELINDGVYLMTTFITVTASALLLRLLYVISPISHGYLYISGP